MYETKVCILKNPFTFKRVHVGSELYTRKSCTKSLNIKLEIVIHLPTFREVKITLKHKIDLYVTN